MIQNIQLSSKAEVLTSTSINLIPQKLVPVVEQVYNSQREIFAMDVLNINSGQTLIVFCGKNIITILLYKDKEKSILSKSITGFKLLQKIQVTMNVTDKTDDYYLKQDNKYKDNVWSFLKQNRQQFPQPKESLLAVRIVQKNDEIFLASGGELGILHIISLSKEQQHKILKGHFNMIIYIHYSRYCNQLFTCSKDGSIILWDIQNQKSIKRYRDPDSIGEITTVQTCQNDLLAASTEGYILIFDVLTGELKRKINFQPYHNIINQIEIFAQCIIYRSANGIINVISYTDEIHLKEIRDINTENSWCRFYQKQDGTIMYAHDKGKLVVQNLRQSQKPKIYELEEGTIRDIRFIEFSNKIILLVDQKIQIIQL